MRETALCRYKIQGARRCVSFRLCLCQLRAAVHGCTPASLGALNYFTANKDWADSNRELSFLHTCIAKS